MEENRIHYNVIFDTSAVYNYPHNNAPLERALEELKSNSSKCSVKLYIPFVTEKELKQHCLDFFNSKTDSHNRSLADIKKLFECKNKEVKIDDSQKEELINATFEKGAINNTLPVEFSKIDFNALVEMAVKYERPFQKIGKRGVKGFKDALVAESIFQNIDTLLSEGKVALVVNDNKLREYLGEKFKDQEDIEIYDSLPAFKSSLNLQLIDIDDKAVDEITKKADEFFRTTFPQSVLKRRINEEYGHLISNPKTVEQMSVSINVHLESYNTSRTYLPVDSGRVDYANPVFIKRDGKMFKWSTTILHKQKYELDTSKTSNLGYSPFSREYEYIIEIEIGWEAKYTDDEFTDSKIVSTSLINDSFEYLSPYYTDVTPSSGTTTLGQQASPSPPPPDEDDEDIFKYYTPEM
ncbi:MAG: PIN domain-containing protein [Patescibacteria group bacterium]